MKSFFFGIFLLLLCENIFASVEVQDVKQNISRGANEFTVLEWQHILNFLSKGNFQEFLRLFNYGTLSDRCRNATQLFHSKLASTQRAGLNDQYWYLKMLDASGEIPSGIFGGNTVSLGNIYSCHEVNVHPDKLDLENKNGFRGRYFSVFLIPIEKSEAKTSFKSSVKLAGVHHPGSMTWAMPDSSLPKSSRSLRSDAANVGTISIPRVALCLPSTCSDEDVSAGLTAIINQTLDLLAPGSNSTIFPYIRLSSSADDVWHYDAIDIFAIVLTSLIGLLIIIGTSLEVWFLYSPESAVEHKKSKPAVFLLGFSAYQNSRVLFNTTPSEKKSSSSEVLHCINGIRAISITWVIVGHVYGNLNQTPNNNNGIQTKKMVSGHLFQAVINAFPSVDTFFVLSGCLVAYLTLKELDRSKGRVNWIMVLVHRYLRLTGVYAYIILLHTTLLQTFSGGPGDIVPIGKENCRQSWWRHLLYVTNFDFKSDDYDSDITCIGQTWYLDNDMQMFLVAPLIIFPLWRFKKIGLAMSSIWVAASCIIPFALTIHHDWPATPLLDFTGTFHYTKNNYTKPWCRFSPYVCGILLGYLLHETKNKKFKMPKELNIFIWLVAFVTGYMVVFGLNLPDVLLEQEMPSKAANAVYGGFSRLAWGLAVSWVIFACSRGYGGWINRFLSWEGFEPIAKLSYNIYLIHMSILFILCGRDDFTVSLSQLFAISRVFYVTLYSIFFSAILFICVEVPWANTEKFIFSLALPTRAAKPKAT